jgi:AraC-like DNA-binding protein
VATLALAAGMSSRAVSRELKDTSLASARDWLAAGRVLRAHWELRDSAVRIRHLVAIMGYSSEEPLANDVAAVTGRTPSELRRLSPDDLVTLVAERLAPALVAGPCGEPQSGELQSSRRRSTIVADMMSEAG